MVLLLILNAAQVELRCHRGVECAETRWRCRPRMGFLLLGQHLTNESFSRAWVAELEPHYCVSYTSTPVDEVATTGPTGGRCGRSDGPMPCPSTPSTDIHVGLSAILRHQEWVLVERDVDTWYESVLDVLHNPVWRFLATIGARYVAEVNT